MLFVESSQPPAEIFDKVPGLDKVAHFFAFGLLGLLVCGLKFSYSKTKQPIPFFSLPLLIVSLSGILEESYQAFVPGRSASLPDLLADMLGAVCAIIFANRLVVSKQSQVA